VWQRRRWSGPAVGYQRWRALLLPERSSALQLQVRDSLALQSNKTRAWFAPVRRKALFDFWAQRSAQRKGEGSRSVIQGEAAFRDLRSHSPWAGISFRFTVRSWQAGRQAASQRAALVTCSREEITFPSWTSSTMVRIWRVVTGPATEKDGTVTYREVRRKRLNNFRGQICYYQPLPQKHNITPTFPALNTWLRSLRLHR